jgi:hypothetical protein
MAAAAIYLAETAYEAMFDTTIDATTNPTTTNYITIENYLANILHGKLGVTTALTTDPELSQARIYVGTLIRLFGSTTVLEQDYISPEEFVISEDFLDKVPRFNWLVEDIRNNLDTEEPPAYYYDMDDYFGRGTKL